jgi:RHS repeat-associated protein
MGSQRIASSIISHPYQPLGWGEPVPGEEIDEGEDGFTNPTIEDVYSELSDGVIVDMQATLRELFEDPRLKLKAESFHLQRLEPPLATYCPPDPEYGDGRDGLCVPNNRDPLCHCEQNLYWANEAGYDCPSLNILYFYHPDYFGSVEFITDMRGEPYQFFLNTPWGDQAFKKSLVDFFSAGAGLPRGPEDQYAKSYTSFSSRFRFNEGRAFKNKPVAYFSAGAGLPRWQWDEEPTLGSSRAPLKEEWGKQTGNYCYGARYYDPKMSVWLSVDKMASRGPNISPYAYSHNNPVMMVDPDGNWPFWLGVTFTYLELDVGGGDGVGYNSVRHAGVARDEVGKTHFLMGSRGVVDAASSGRTETIGGLSASATANVRQSWKRETFMGMLNDEGWSATGDFGAGPSVTAGFGDSELTFGAGIGAGGRISVNSTEILESISLTWGESDVVNEQVKGSETWGISNVRKSEDWNYYLGNVTVGSGKDKVVTDQIVRSDADQKVWMSQKYIDAATKAERL